MTDLKLDPEPEDDERSLCRICLVEPRRVLWTACGHFIACPSCSDRIVAKNAKCPMCATVILSGSGIRLIDAPQPALGGALSFLPNDVDASAAAAAAATAAAAAAAAAEAARLEGEEEEEDEEEEEEEEEEEDAPEMQMRVALLAEAADDETRLEQTRHIRNLSRREEAPPLRAAIAAGVLPHMVAFLSSESAQLQMEASWVLTNIAAADNFCVRAVIDAGALPLLVAQLRSPDIDVCEQATWCLGNIAGDRSACRDAVIAAGTVAALAALSERELPLKTMRKLVWSMSNCARGKPNPPLRDLEATLPVLTRYILFDDVELLADVCKALSNISDGPNERIQAVLDAGVAQRVVELLAHPDTGIVKASLRCVGNLVTGEETQTQAAIDFGAVPLLHRLLTQERGNERVLKEACWTISNITAGTRVQIQAVLDDGVIPTLVELTATASSDVVKECVWALSNATELGSRAQLRFLVQQGCIPPLCDALASADARMVAAALYGLEQILRAGKEDAEEEGGDSVNVNAQRVDEAGGPDKLEALQHHHHDQNAIYEQAARLLGLYFG